VRSLERLEASIEMLAISSVQCAPSMEQQMIMLNMKMAAQGRQFLRMRIVHVTGLVVGGSLSSMECVKYATVDDSVGAAARLESFD
jgi:hypothetical protein